ncbi:F-actin-uncapping protein LRRC16A isoform X1 [Oreochromis niloticus]|uniref:F-actin-uncapping protein LRRC16A isoform X1 n=1 Tax=Oreochromis niloticus TaxID=8128 RepID=UPI0009046287|nr:F-actin-uncapping protein LRRC16A isoform X1 [Oreochromis niloticus]XP_019206390.1 F-actin-uncapping protein LRRC16A isoform X1 [Oreochromis niloticus]XP_019206391.1 F-actin-uncapping protein LRRC16A isoform X1 [Oreochromis niloticus]XP_019206392.1 F-actin-uncapping protein LRRC16A isoform X1 [Oreochromis niloticus]
MSEETTDCPNELFESVREAVGRRVKLTLRRKVQLEVKGDKVENKVLALASHRAFLLTARVPSKVEQSFSYLEILGIQSNKPTQLVLEHEHSSWSLRLGSAEEVDKVIAHIGNCLHRICPAGVPVKMMRKLNLKPPDRLAALQAIWDEQASADLGPCGGFSHQYWCVCDYLRQPYREEVQWDVDTIYLTQDTKELNLQDFVHLDNKDLIPIITVLEYNQWFTKLSTKDYKLPTDVYDQILRVVARSSRLEELVLDNAGLKSDFAQKLAGALAHNPASTLQTLNLSNNSLEDKGVAALSAQFAKLPMGLKHVNLSRTSMSPKGVNSLCQALCANPIVASTLTHLDLSGNSLRGDDLPNLHSFLSHSNVLETLDLSNSDCCLEQVCSSLLRGSLKHLSVLNMSKTVFSHRKCKEIPPSFKQFFSSAQALTSVSLSGTKLPLEALKSLLLGLGCNPNLSDVSLDLSCCEVRLQHALFYTDKSKLEVLGKCLPATVFCSQLRSGGSQILEGCIAEIPNITSLDISDNGLDMDLTTLLVWLAKNRSIRHLSLGKNFNNIKSKNVAQVLDNLVHMIQEEESPLTSLSLADSKLKADLSIVLNALGSNTSLTKLDISGNSMGDMGAKILAKALQINTKLRTLVWDRNNVSPQGLQDVAAALEKNYTIRFMPVPIMDAAQALKANPEKTEDALLKMEQYLLRNHETRKYLQEQAYRLQQGIVTTTTQQMMDMMCVRVQDHLNSLRFTETSAVQEDMKVAENLMKDARNSKTLLPNLYHLKSAGSTGTCVGAIQDKLESMAGEIAAVMDDQLQTMLRTMVDTAEALCPNVMKKSSLRQELLKAGAGRMTIPRSFITTTLLEQSGVDIINKISEVKLGVASFLSDRIVDEILESLSRSQHTLADHLIRKDQPLVHHEPHLEMEVLDETVLQPENYDQDQNQDRENNLDDMDSTMIPKSKRKSILVRMLRPVSVAFELEFDLDKALEEVPIHVEDPPLPSPSQLDRTSAYYEDLPPPPTPQDAKSAPLAELPPMEHKTLEHHTKFRPKPKRTKPARPHREATGSSAPQEAEQNSIMGKLDEGLDDFFSKKVIKLSFKIPSGKGPSTSTQEGADKKRESRKSGFFNLIKRTSRLEKSHGSAAIAPPQPASSAAAAPLSPCPVTKETTPGSPTSPVKTCPIVPEPEQEPHRSHSSNHTDSEVEASPAATENAEEEKEKKNVENKENLEKTEHVEKVEKKGNPHKPRHIGVPMMGMDLMAEMKARQERMAGKKTESAHAQDKVDGDKAKSEVHPAVPADTDESKPEPTPRAKPPGVTPKPPPPQANKAPLAACSSGPLSPTSPRPSSTYVSDECANAQTGSLSPKAPLPAPRLKRAPSEQERASTSSNPAEALSPQNAGENPADGDVFDGSVVVSGAGSQRSSSLKRTVNLSAPSEDNRERTKSLPAYVRPPSLSDAPLSPADEEVDLKSNKSEDESSDDTTSV